MVQPFLWGKTISNKTAKMLRYIGTFVRIQYRLKNNRF